MSNKPKASAFPYPPTVEHGMSKRFYVACAAMQGLITNREGYTEGNNIEVYRICKDSFLFADELLKQEAE